MYVYRGGGCKAKNESKERPVWKVVKNDMKGLGLASVDALDWRMKIVGDTSDPGLPGAHWDFSQDKQIYK